MATPVLQLPCGLCGELACSVTLAELPADVRGFLIPLLKLGAFKYGVKLTPGVHPLEALPAAEISAALELRCGPCTRAGALFRLDQDERAARAAIAEGCG